MVLGDAWDLVKFFNDDAYVIDEKSAAKELKPEAAEVLDATLSALAGVGEWNTANIEAALKAALLDGLELAPQGVRSHPGGGHRRDGQPAAVRVDGIARP